MDRNFPLVSVLMPVYNCEPFLDEAIRSIRNQTFTDFEFVIVNDGSTDGSLDTILRHAAEDLRIVVLDRSNGGIVDALNAGLAVCRGEFIARMDGDDIALPERLEFQVSFMQRHHDIDACGTECKRIDSSGTAGALMGMPTDHNSIVSRMLKAKAGVMHPSLMIKRSTIEAVEGYRPFACLVEDIDLLLRVAICGSLANLPECLMLYRQRDGQICHPYNYEQSLATLRVMEAAQIVYGHKVIPTISATFVRMAWQYSDNNQHFEAIKCALKAVRMSPLGLDSWKSLVRSVFKRIYQASNSQFEQQCNVQANHSRI